MANAWINHVKSYQMAHPNKSYKECLKDAKHTYKKQSGGNPAVLAAASKAADTLGSITNVAGDVTKGILGNIQHRRDASNWYDDKGRERALKSYRNLIWRKTHGILRRRTDPNLTDADLKAISGLNRYL